MIVVNFKNYKIGKRVLDLAKKIDGKNVIAAVPAINIKELADKTKLKVYAQHVDHQLLGKTTGFILPESIKQAGAVGSLLNHSEHLVSIKDIELSSRRCKKVGLKLIICTSSLRQVREIKKLKPFAIAFEDPKLIATGKSITKHRSNDLKKFVSILGKSRIIPLCGAGISSKEDYEEALKLGCKGVLVSSVITKSRNTKKFLNAVS